MGWTADLGDPRGAATPGSLIVDVAVFAPEEILEELGQGAMGVVHKAHDPQLDRIVAIKTLREDLGLPLQTSTEFRQHFYQEASAAGRLNHPLSGA